MRRLGTGAIVAAASGALAVVGLIACGTFREDGNDRPPRLVAPPPSMSRGLDYKVPETPADRRLPSPTLFVTAGSGGGACTREDPCGNFARAYAVARPGAVVEVADGRYPSQILYRQPGKRGNEPIEFVPAPGAEVTLRYLALGKYINDLGADNVAFRDMTIGGLLAWRNTGLTLRNVTMKGTFYLQGSQDVALLGGSVGGTSNGDHPDIVTWMSQSSDDRPVTPRNILIDGVLFHDMQMGKPGDHMSCMQVQNADGITVRNSRFRNCDTFDTRWDAVSNALIENNIFEPARKHYGTATYYGLSLREGRNVTIRNNVSPQAWAGPRDPENHPLVQNFNVTNNVFGVTFTCDARVAYRNNIWVGKGTERCGTSDRSFARESELKLNAAYRPLPGSPLIDGGWAHGASAVDGTGRRRPQGSAPDVGPFER